MWINSIKIWLLLVINLIIVGSLSFTAFISYRDAMHELDEIYDAQLARNARLIGTMLTALPSMPPEQPLIISVPELPDTGEHLTSEQQRQSPAHKYERKLAFQVWHKDQLIMASANAEHFPTPKPQEGYHDITENGMQWISFSLPQANDVWVYTAQREDVRQEMSEHIALAQIRPILLLMLPLSILIYFVVKIILKPLNKLQQIVSEKKAEQLTEINLKQPVELQPIQLAINQLIGRVTHYINQEKRFVADAAHELRTPLSILQLHAQNLQNTVQPEEIKEAAISIMTGSKRMTHLVNQLLTISRLERVQDIHRTEISLSQLVQDSLSQLPFTLLDKVHWHMDLPAALVVSGDEILLQSALRNVLDNASKYSVPNGTVNIFASVPTPNNIHLIIQNKSTAIVEPARMGNRFFRHQGHQSIEGSGLGLSIVQRIIELHGGKAHFACSKTGEISVTLQFLQKAVD